MIGSLRDEVLCLALIATLVLCAGCGGGQANPSPRDVAGGPAPPPGDRGPAEGATEGPGSSPGIRQIMAKLAKGPNSLTPVLGRELKADPPAWETIEPQSKEYALLAAELGHLDPPKGSRDSWAKLSAAYAGSAADLEKAVQARDKEAALEAHGQLANSCMSCHREHRRMGRVGGGPPPT